MKRLALVTDNPLIVAPIRRSLDEATFTFLGYLPLHKATVERIEECGAEVVLVDEGDRPEQAIALTRSIASEVRGVVAVLLTVKMDGEWVQRALESGVVSAISKAISPGALATLLREALNGHIVHSPAAMRKLGAASRPAGVVPCTLTDREQEVLRLVAAGATNQEIAQQLWITQQTVKFHLANVYRKLEVSNRTAACHYAHVNGLVTRGEALHGAP